MIKIFAFFSIAIVCLLLYIGCKSNSSLTNTTIDLAGKWTLALDSTDTGFNQHWYDSLFATQIALPGTLDDAGIGTPNSLEPKLEKPQILHLTRRNSYTGAAWYTRDFEVPKQLDNKEFVLQLERVLWKSTVWIDGKPLGTENSLSTAHRYSVAGLKAGKHRIAICIDNRKQFDISVKDMAHAYTNETQVIWNGIIGKIQLEPIESVQISNIIIYPDIDKKQVRVTVDVNNKSGKEVTGTINLTACVGDTCVNTVSKKITIDTNKSQLEFFYDLGADMKLWSEFEPNVYTMNVQFLAQNINQTASTTFGMREITNKNGYLQINGKQVFLRGTLECNIFPLTGNPPMTTEGWQKVFETAHQWGLNHLRFHSWCPPKAAFEVADKMGFYLQVELPLWSLTVGKDSLTTRFLEIEAQRIIAEYGNHPSFCLWSMGNELEGDAQLLNSWVTKLKAQDPRHLYMGTTFSFQKGLGTEPLPADDIFVTQWTANGWVRGQGVFNSEPPSFDKNYSSALNAIDIPVITHEIGQYSVYPNISEIAKYKGSLVPLNFIAVKNDLEKRGLLNKAQNFLLASGKLAAILYKEEIERAMKTPQLSGFQLLDLHDFPGQGTALVGLLDAFWDSKGIVSANEFSAFCSPIVPLLSFPKAVYKNSETFEASVGLANFGNKTLNNSNITWKSIDEKGKVIDSGAITANALPIGYNSNIEKIAIPLNSIDKAQRLTIELKIANTSYCNSWNIWVYPDDLKIEHGAVVVTTNLKAAQKALAEGKKVLFNPAWREIQGIEGKFVPVFWSPVHFPKQAGTMGVLCNPAHNALRHFPTEQHSNWQWWDLNINSTTVVLDSISIVTPIVEMIDNFVSNRRLASVFEAKVGSGSLVFCSIDVISDIENRSAAKQLLYSLLTYMNSDSFKPVHSLSAGDINSLLTSKSSTNTKKKSEDVY